MQQRLKEMVVAPVGQDDLGGCIGQRLGGGNPFLKRYGRTA
jgi:hypothetical protein